MARIKGKFAPLMAELAEDERWLLQLNDTEKFIYMLILFTIYTTNGTAPEDPDYYKVRYNLTHRKHTISTAIAHIKTLFPKLACSNKKLSLINAVAYKNRVDTQKPLEEEVEREEEKEYIGALPEISNSYEKDFDQLEAFKTIFAQYPNPIGEGAAKRHFCLAISNRANFELMQRALENYRTHLKANGWKQAKEARNWFKDEWMTWINHKEPEKPNGKDRNDDLLATIRGK